MIQAGQLRHFASFKAPTETVTDGDTSLDPFIEEFTAWVQIQPLSGSEETIADQPQASRTSLVTMRYDSRVQPRLEMHARNRTFQVLSVLNIDERDIELQLTCREIV